MCLFFVCQIFQGNANPTDVAKAAFPKPTLTRYLRIRPYTWETGIALRFEVYGCKISGWSHKNLVLFTAPKTNCQQHNWDISKILFRTGVLIQISKRCFVNTPLHHDLSIRWFTFCLLWRQAYREVFIHPSESHVRTARVQESRSYCIIDKCSRQRKGPCIHVSPRLDVLHSKWMACTACTAFYCNLFTSTPIPPLPSSPELTSQPLTDTDVHIAHAIVHAEIYTHQSQSGPAGSGLICILICMFWHGSTLPSFDCKGFRIISASLLRTFPHMCRRRTSVFGITHRLWAIHSTCVGGLFLDSLCVYTDSTLSCACMCAVRHSSGAQLLQSCFGPGNRPHSKHITRAEASQWHHQWASGSLVLMRPSWATDLKRMSA